MKYKRIKLFEIFYVEFLNNKTAFLYKPSEIGYIHEHMCNTFKYLRHA